MLEVAPWYINMDKVLRKCFSHVHSSDFDTLPILCGNILLCPLE